jgi:hypothetical protein
MLLVACICGRMGIALQLVRQLEQWFELMSAEYTYIAIDKSNEASLRLFTGRCGYTEYRKMSLLVHPVHWHRLKAPHRATVVHLSAHHAERLYRRTFAHEFFPTDITTSARRRVSASTFTWWFVYGLTGSRRDAALATEAVFASIVNVHGARQGGSIGNGSRRDRLAQRRRRWDRRR